MVIIVMLIQKYYLIEFVIITIVVIILLPFFVYAETCKNYGLTVVFVNGILTNQDSAIEQKIDLKDILPSDINNEPVNVELGYNPSHIAGLGDVVQSVSQVLGSSMSDFDLKTILMQIHSEVKTQKILLIGHSQGTFYTNEMYNYLTTHGVPKESISVYNIATPASFVVGGGKYLTSGNDNLINSVREWTASVDAKQPLTANILIPLSHPEEKGLTRGHSLSDEYLAGGANRIVSDITKSLNILKVDNTKKESDNDGCFESLPTTFSYRIQKSVFAVADPFAQTTINTAVTTRRAVASAGLKVVSGIATVINAVNNSLSGLSPSKSSSLNDAISNNLASVGSAPISTKTIFELELPPVPKELLQSTKSDTNQTAKTTTKNTLNIKTEKTIEKSQKKIVVKVAENTKSSMIPDLIPVNVPYAGFGGDGGASKAAQDMRDAQEAVANSVTTVPNSPTFTSPTINSSFSTSTITFSGTASSTLVISQDFSNATTTADINNEWSMTLQGFSQGTTAISFIVTDSNNIQSASSSISVFVDTIVPSINNFAVLQCSYSLRSAECLSGSSDVSLSWTSTSTDVSYYGIAVDGVVGATTTATSTSVTISNGSSSTLSVVVYDNIGNSATSTSQFVEVFEMPIVINEIAWNGTKASPYDEWIELYNRTNYTLNLSSVVLSASDFDVVPYIPLSGTINANSYYLIERGIGGDATNVTENLAVAFSGVGSGSGLNDSGEILNLIHSIGTTASTTLDSTPSLSLCGNTWCGGKASTTPISMERVSPDVLGTIASNWGSNNTFNRNGADSNGDTINGTPKSRNSNNLLSIGYYCPPESSTYISGNYYTPSSWSCTYLSSTISGNRYGDLYKGTVASSTFIAGHSLNIFVSKTDTDSYSGAVQGDDYFVAIYQTKTISIDEINLFRNYFESGLGAPPHLDYGILEWKYGY